MMTDPISDMLARIKNACLRRFDVVDVPLSKIKYGILKVLEREGYINGIEEVEVDGRNFLRVSLKYYEGKSVIKALDRVSKPSRRVYSKLKKVSLAFNGFGIYVLSTSRGILSDAEARDNNIGGEILCRVF
ncbi:MAG: 30S ribosomal protein S8 [Holosporaceae bacterium]|jgi:small subunit ribosomal protein S8|nr:30S ribosomal protein S8 [Holosporaceae bacterium]